jgi:hypothetical protein
MVVDWSILHDHLRCGELARGVFPVRPALFAEIKLCGRHKNG